MKFARLVSLLALSFALHAAPARADDTLTLPVAIPAVGTVSVVYPATWKQKVKMDMERPASTLTITDATHAISLQITFLADPDGRFASKETLDAAVTKSGQHYLPGAVEKEVALVHYSTGAGTGCYAAFTDKDLVDVAKPKEGQFRKVLTGIFSFGKKAAVFTLDSNDTDSPEYRQALLIVTKGISAP